ARIHKHAHSERARQLRDSVPDRAIADDAERPSAHLKNRELERQIPARPYPAAVADKSRIFGDAVEAVEYIREHGLCDRVGRICTSVADGDIMFAAILDVDGVVSGRERADVSEPSRV